MLDTYLLKELATFAQAGTLAQTARLLNVTQPTVTRGLQKLESELGVTLFDRQPNRLSLTATGKLAANEAATLLQAQQLAVNRIHNFDASQRVLKVGAILPGPLAVLHHFAAELPQNVTLLPLVDTATPAENLLNSEYSLLFTNQPVVDSRIENQLVGTERLAVNLNQFMFQANQSTITFAELNNLSFVVLSDIGPWRDIIQQQIPKAKFFYQKEQDALREITQYSDFPYFSTNISQLDDNFVAQSTTHNRICLPITDETAQMPIYATYLRSNQAQVASIVSKLKSVWPA